MGRLISLVNFHEMALQSIWWRDISKDPLFEPFQAKFQPERTHSSRLVVSWSEIDAQKSAFHSDNAPSHKSTVPMTKLRIGLWIDSTLLTFFPNLKIWLGGKKFSSNEEVIVNEYFADFETAYFKWLPNVKNVKTMLSGWNYPFWLKFGLKGFEEWIFWDVASSNGL